MKLDTVIPQITYSLDSIRYIVIKGTAAIFVSLLKFFPQLDIKCTLFKKKKVALIPPKSEPINFQLSYL